MEGGEHQPHKETEIRTVVPSIETTTPVEEQDNQLRERIRDLAEHNQVAFINMQNAGERNPFPIELQQVSPHIIGLTPDLQHMIIDASSGSYTVSDVAERYADAINKHLTPGRIIHKGHLTVYTAPTPDDLRWGDKDRVKGYQEMRQTVIEQLPQVTPLIPLPENP